MEALIARVVSLTRLKMIATNKPDSKTVATLYYLQNVLDGKVAVPGIITTLVAELACDGRVDGGYLNDQDLPTTDFPMVDNAQLEHYGKHMKSDEVLADLKKRKRRGATAAETLLYGVKDPEEQRKYWIAGLGQSRSGGGPLGGWRSYYVVLFGDTWHRSVSMVNDENGWPEDCRFLSFPL